MAGVKGAHERNRPFTKNRFSRVTSFEAHPKMSLRRIKRKDGRQVYHLDIRVPDPNRPDKKKRIIKSLRTTDRNEAQERYYELARVLTLALPRPTGDVTLDQLYRRVMEYQELDHAPGTTRTYKTAFRSLFLSIDRNLPLSSLSRALIDTWRIQVGHDLEATTLNQYVNKIKAAFNLAVGWGMVEANPFHGLKPLIERRDEDIHYFSAGEISTILNYVDAHRLGGYYAPAIRLSLYAGLRANEVCQLRPESVTDSHLKIEMRTKGRRHRLVPMFGATRAAARARTFEGQEWLFPAHFNRSKSLHPHVLGAYFKRSCVLPRFPSSNCSLNLQQKQL